MEKVEVQFRVRPKVSSAQISKIRRAHKIPLEALQVFDTIKDTTIIVSFNFTEYHLIDSLALAITELADSHNVRFYRFKVKCLTDAYRYLLGIIPKNKEESKVVNSKQWQQAVLWGYPRPGHPEGKIIFHIKDVLDNVSIIVPKRLQNSARLLALIHDSFKGEVDMAQLRTGENHHARIAMRFAERIGLSKRLQVLIDRHDEAYNAFMKGYRDNNWKRADDRLAKLASLLKKDLNLYHLFFACDNFTGSKTDESLRWFESKLDLREIARPKH